MSNIDSSNSSMQTAGIPNVRRPNGGRPKRRIPFVVASIIIPLARRAAMMKDCRVYYVQSIYSAIVYITMQIIIT